MRYHLDLTARRLTRPLIAGLLLVAACGGGPPSPGGASPQRGTQQETLSELFNLTGLYQRIGRVAAGPPIPFVGQFAFMAGRGDSTATVLGISLTNRALAFQRLGRDFVARYRVEMAFERPDSLPVRFARQETVTVPVFEETQRVDETVVFQQAFLLEPGEYRASVTVRDPVSGSFSRSEMALTVPRFGPGTFTAPILVYEDQPRTSLWSDPSLILNPRGMVAHGDDSLVAIVEAYELGGQRDLPLEVRDEAGRVLFTQTLTFPGQAPVETRSVVVPAQTPSLGRVTLSVGAGPEKRDVVALVSFSRSWVLTNYDNLLDLLRFFGYEERLAELRRAPPEDRAALWRAFWKETDPDPDTPGNEAMDVYFTRLAIADERFRDEAGAGGGWRSERGEVYITLGEPDQVYESPPGNDTRIIQWVYSQYRATLQFQGQIGFSRLRLTPESRAEFARIRSLARQRQRGG